MSRYTRILLTAVAACAVLALPATVGANPGKGEAKSQAKSQNGKGKTKRCAKTQKVGYSVSGTLLSATADNPATPANDSSITIRVTGANSHARNSGEIADQDANTKGVQVAGATYTVSGSDPFTVNLIGYEAPDTPSVGDAVHVTGKIARTKSKCAPSGTSTADRYAAPDVRTVTVTDSDPDA
jgi:hypothetical protein